MSSDAGRPEEHRPGSTSRRRALAMLSATAGAIISVPVFRARAESAFSFGLTPVFLDSDIQLLANLEEYLARRIGQPVALVKRRTYQEITALLLSGQLDAAWICGFPYVQYPDQLALVAVPLYQGQPLYQSYVIVTAGSDARVFDDLKGRTHAFSDPDSNSGFLVTRHLLATKETTPSDFFSSFFFTYGHRNVIRAVGAGLAESGSVDGYVWDVVAEREPQLAERTRVIRRSELLGFPPVACLKSARSAPAVMALQDALINMPADPLGRELLKTLQLDGFTAGSPDLFATIAEKWRVVRAQS
jgi:phosphonate transport system substrate-binding protein